MDVDFSKVKGVIFDYGGTLDTGGDHWSHVIWAAWQKAGVECDEPSFREAYVYAERELARTLHILPHHDFRDLLEIKVEIELQKLSESGRFAPAQIQEKSRGIRGYFRKIIESAVVGVRKPDPEIFMLGVKALGVKPEETLVVGDSYGKDIVPALKAGCQAIWLKGRGWTEEEDKTLYPSTIGKLDEILGFLEGA